MSSYTILIKRENGEEELVSVEAESPKDAVVAVTGTGDLTGVEGIVGGSFDDVEAFWEEMYAEARALEILEEDAMWDEIHDANYDFEYGDWKY